MKRLGRVPLGTGDVNALRALHLFALVRLKTKKFGLESFERALHKISAHFARLNSRLLLPRLGPGAAPVTDTTHQVWSGP